MSALSAGLGQLSTGATQLDMGLNGNAAAGITGLKDGVTLLQSAVYGEDGLAAGLANASTGAKALAKGNADLYAGTTALSAGAKSASEGAATLAAGTVTLHNGATQLDSGATTLATGIGTLQSGSTALIDGVKQLDDGANQLNSGMIQFNEEGIKKLVSAFDGDLSAVLDKANGMIDTSKAYKSFTGISDGMDGEVKFVFVTNK